MSSIESLNAARIEAIATTEALPQRLAKQLGATAASPSSATQFRAPFARRMAPALSYGRHAGPAPITARQAAVMLLLFRRAGQWHVPLTQRPAALLRHGGQISLPGGRLEIGESSEAAARRELAEELGFAASLTMLGQLPVRYVYASDYLVAPHLAAANSDVEWRPDPSEVERVVELPLASLLDPSSIGQMTIQRGPLVFYAPCFMFGEHRVWGATAVILAELADIVRLAFNASTV